MYKLQGQRMINYGKYTFFLHSTNCVNLVITTCICFTVVESSGQLWLLWCSRSIHRLELIDRLSIGTYIFRLGKSRASQGIYLQIQVFVVYDIITRSRIVDGMYILTPCLWTPLRCQNGLFWRCCDRDYTYNSFSLNYILICCIVNWGQTVSIVGML